MKKRPFEKITITEIAENCGAGRSTFYHYFHDKYDLANCMYKRQLENRGEDLLKGNAPRVLLVCLNYIMDHSSYYLNLVSYEGQNSFFELVQELSLQWWSDLLESARKKDPETAEELSYSISFFSTGAAAMLRKWIRGGFKTPGETLARYLLRSVPFNLYTAMQDSEIEKYTFI